jgi:hypothetical protein
MADPRIAEAATCKLAFDLMRHQSRSGARDRLCVADGRVAGRTVRGGSGRCQVEWRGGVVIFRGKRRWTGR